MQHAQNSINFIYNRTWGIFMPKVKKIPTTRNHILELTNSLGGQMHVSENDEY